MDRKEAIKKLLVYGLVGAFIFTIVWLFGNGKYDAPLSFTLFYFPIMWSIFYGIFAVGLGIIVAMVYFVEYLIGEKT